MSEDTGGDTGQQDGGRKERNRVGPTDLGLDLSGGREADLFRWLAACVLFGARIKQELAASAYAVLEREGVLTPAGLAGADRQHLVDLLREGHYRRYDETKADDLIQLGHDVGERYGGQVSRLRVDADGPKEIRRRLQQLKGIGPTAADIFLREVGPEWRG